MVQTWLKLGFLSVCQSLLLIYSAWIHSPTPDELGHLVAGFSHWQLGDYSLYRVNPPLARMVATLPIYLVDGSDQWLQHYIDPGKHGRSEFIVASQFLYHEKVKFLNWVSMARTTSVLFSLIGLWVCYSWAKLQYGQQAGWVAALLWTFSPFVLGFGAILTPDVPSAAMGALAIFSFVRWLRTPTFLETFFCGLSLGLAELTKSTWIVLPPIFLLAVVFKILQNRIAFRLSAGSSAIELLSKFGLIYFIGWFVFVAGYGFDGLFLKLGDLKLRSNSLVSQIASSNCEENSSLYRFLALLPVPLPEQYVIGMDFQKHDVQTRQQPTFLCGKLLDKGVWYYYLFGLGVKSTIGGLTLFLLSCAVRIGKRQGLDLPEWIMWITIGFVLLLLSAHTGLNKHTRYILPIIPLLIVWASQTANWFVYPLARLLVYLGLVSSVMSSLLTFPNSMSYFNEIVGGPKNGRYLLSNSNVDWNQDLYMLRHELSRRGWSRVGLVCHANYDVRILGFNFFVPPVPPKLREIGEPELKANQGRLNPGRYAVSVCHWQGYPVGTPNEHGGRAKAEPNLYSYFQEFTPVGMVGYSILLFDISQADIDQSITWRAKNSQPLQAP